jgi:hypothetical protein
VNTRIDIVVVELDPTANTIVTKIVSGTAVAADPVAPTLTQSPTGIYQLPISTLTIPASSVAITDEMLTDTRTFMGNRVGIWTTATRPADPTDYQTIGYNTTEGYHEYWSGTAWVALVAPPASANFVIDLDETAFNTYTFESARPAGPYSISFSSPDLSFDVYLVDSTGATVGYSNNTSIVASSDFVTVIVLGVANSQIATFLYTGSVSNPTSAGEITGAGAYLTSISPSNLPVINDTATVTGGNFANDVEILFENGALSLPAKNIVRTNSKQLIVTRPDALIEDNAPYDLRAINPGVVQPSGSNVNVLVDAVTGGSDPQFVTASLIEGARVGTAFTSAIVTTDGDGAVVNRTVTAGTFPAGLTLNSSTGAITGTPTAAVDYFFTVQITDNGGNTNTREFNLPTALFVYGGSAATSGGFTYRTFTSSGTLVVKNGTISSNYLVVAGGGGGGSSSRGGGGGAGGLLNSTASLNGSYPIAIGAGGSSDSSGNHSALTGVAFSQGGGKGGSSSSDFSSRSGGGGGSGGGSGWLDQIGGANPGTGIAGQGFGGGQGGVSGYSYGGGGGGSLEAGNTNGPGSGGDGQNFAAWSSATGTGASSCYAGGGSGGAGGQGGLGGGGGSGQSGLSSTGGGGGNFGRGGLGVVIVRWAI